MKKPPIFGGFYFYSAINANFNNLAKSIRVFMLIFPKPLSEWVPH